ncbi:MAG: LapA family protein [Desulfobacterota bacterium]|nr:LapA family protein [Thermodesulfobacteriota bacterium]
MRLFINTCAVVVILFSLVWFATNNAQTVLVNISPYYSMRVSLWSVIMVPFLVGVVIGNALDMIQRFKLRRELKRLRQTVERTAAHKTP